MMDSFTDSLTPLAFDLVRLIGLSDRFTAMAADLLDQGLQSINTQALAQEAQQGLGEALAIAYYKAMVLLPSQPTLMQGVADLLLRYRLLCALDGLEDRRTQAFWLRHGLDRELLESEALHATARLTASRQIEQLCFGRFLADYFRVEQDCSLETVQTTAFAFTGLEAVVGHLWSFQADETRPLPDRQAFLLAPPSHIGIVSSRRLCALVAELLPVLTALYPDPDAVICAPLGTRKVSLSKQGLHSCSTYFDGGKPVPFSLNRSLEPYLVLSPFHMTQTEAFRSPQLCFAPLLDSLSSLVFRDPADYRLGDGVFLHRPLVLQAHQPLLSSLPAASALLATSSPHCLVEGLLMQSRQKCFALTPCHQFSDRYARVHGLSGHGPSGVMNQSVLITAQGILSTWRYERNFDSWSGRSADVARHPSLNFLAWQPGELGRSAGEAEVHITPLTYSGYPSECKIEDLRLFAVRDQIYAIGALILSRARYRNWLPEIAAEAAANNTIDDMLVVQALGRLDPVRADLAFEHLPVLRRSVDPEAPEIVLPRGFEKNWLVYQQNEKLYLFYSLQPWQVFEADSEMRHWHLVQDRPLTLPASIQGPLRNSAHPFPLGDRYLGLVVHRRRQNSYIYDQYLVVLASDSLEPLKISGEPILSVNVGAVELDQGFRKNPGVCYVSCVLTCEESVYFHFNLFDCRTCVVSVPVADLLELVDDDSAFVSLFG